MKIPQHEIDRKAQGTFRALIAAWAIMEPVTGSDYGIDYLVKPGNSSVSSTESLSGLDFFVQLKGVAGATISNGHIAFSKLDVRHAKYYMSVCRFPVYIVLVDTNTEKVYWVNFDEAMSHFSKNWENQKTVTIKLPIQNEIASLSELFESVKKSHEKLRKKFSTDPIVALQHLNSEFMKKNPGVVAETLVSKTGIEHRILQMPDPKMTLNITGKTENVSKAVSDAFGKGIPVNSEKYGVEIELLTSLVTDSGSIKGGTIHIERKEPATLKLFLEKENGDIRGSLDLFSELRGGQQYLEGIFQMESDVFVSKQIIDLTDEAHPKISGDATLSFDGWAGKDVRTLPNLDLLAGVFANMKDSDRLRSKLYWRGNEIATSTIGQDRQSNIFGMANVIRAISDASYVAKKFNLSLHVPSEITESMVFQPINVRNVLNGESGEVHINDIKFSATVKKNQFELQTSKDKASVAIRFQKPLEVVELPLWGQMIDVGPAIISTDGVEGWEITVLSSENKGELLVEFSNQGGMWVNVKRTDPIVPNAALQ